MTSNVVNWLNMQESERANKARERETERHNRITETETERHNRALEELQSFAEHERARNNLAIEVLRENELNEQIRHNFGSEALTARGHEVSLLNTSAQVGLGYSQLTETERANKEREAVNRLHEMHDYSIKQRQLEPQKQQAHASLLQAQTQEQTMLWTQQIKWPAELRIEQNDALRQWFVGREGLIPGAARAINQGTKAK